MVPRAQFDALGSFQGASKAHGELLAQLCNCTGAHFMPRDLAEEDANFKQLIGYVVVCSQGKILTYTRGKSGGESRLHAKLSIGVGGHINPLDATGSCGLETYRAALLRELKEELHLPHDIDPAKLECLGVINDDSNSVGKVHLGIVHLLQLQSTELSSNEAALCELQWLSAQQLAGEYFQRLESWSQLALQLLPEQI